MKKIILLLLSGYVLALCSCKKSSSAPSIVGTWTMTNVSGNIVSDGSLTQVDTITYSFNTSTNIITVTGYSYHPYTNPPSAQYDTSTYQISVETWTFKTDGTYSINESYVQNANKTSTSVAYTSTGIWEYLSNTETNTGFILTGATPEPS